MQKLFNTIMMPVDFSSRSLKAVAKAVDVVHQSIMDKTFVGWFGFLVLHRVSFHGVHRVAFQSYKSPPIDLAFIYNNVITIGQELTKFSRISQMRSFIIPF